MRIGADLTETSRLIPAAAILLGFSIWTGSCGSVGPSLYQDAEVVVVETAYARLIVSRNGRNRAFISKATGEDYLNSSDPIDFMNVSRNGRTYGSTSVGLEGNRMKVKFGSAGVEAEFTLVPSEEWIILELIQVSGDFEKFRIVNLGLSIREHFGEILNAVYNDDLAVGVQALSFGVESFPRDRQGRSLYEFNFMEMARQRVGTPGDSRILTATLYRSIETTGARVALVTCPGTRLMETLARLELDQGLPHPMIDGVWGKQSPEVEKPYIFIDYDEANVEEVIEYALQGGFGCILSSFPATTSGHFDVDRSRFPSGFDGLCGSVAKIHAAGLRAGTHLMTAGVSHDDRYVTPVPDRRLVKENTFDLAMDIDPETGEIPTLTNPADKGLRTRYTYELNSGNPGLHLQIDDEIIEYGDFASEAPYRFRNCKRGVFGTRSASHKKGSPIYHLGERWNYFVVNQESSMLEEVTTGIANAVNRCGFDLLYFDGAEFVEAQGPRFYFMNRFFDAVYRKLNHDIILQASKTDNMSWHFLSRMASNDAAVAGVRSFLEVLRMDNIRLYQKNFMPGDFGWYGVFLNGPNTDSTLPEEIEYGCVKALAYSEPLGLQVSTAILRQHGRTDEILSVLRRYEKLRQTGSVPQSVKEELRAPYQDFQLQRDDPVTFRRLRSGPRQFVKQSSDREWVYRNPYRDQPLAVRMRALAKPADYSDARNVILLGASDLGQVRGERRGAFTSTIGPSDRTPPGIPSPSIKLKAVNSTNRSSSWASQTIFFETALNLLQHRMIGTWVYGDASGALLNFHVETPGKRPKDFYVDLDFAGWRYVLVPRYEGSRVLDYEWPYVWKFALRPIRWDNIDRFSLFINDVPAGKTVEVHLGPVKAIQMLENELVNPSLTVNGEKIVFPGSLHEDEYLEFSENGFCRQYDANGHLKEELGPLGRVPTLRTGANELRFDCDSEYCGAIVTPIVYGPPVP